MSIDESRYFSRLRLLEEIDSERLRRASVLIGGVGNVGSQVAAFLALAGIGHLVFLDKDTVGPENLACGVFDEDDIGKQKVAALADWVGRRAPFTRSSTLHGDLRTDVPETLFSSFDAVVISADSWSARAHLNSWAHAFPGRTRVVVSGGMSGLSWDMISSVPGQNTGCAQCPHGSGLFRADEEGGCGKSRADPTRIDPAAGFVGGAVAAHIALEVVSAVAGSGPLFAGRMLSFSFKDGAFAIRRIVPDPTCLGHRALSAREPFLMIPAADYRIGDLARLIAERLGVPAGAISLSSDREIVAKMKCVACGREDDVRRPLVTVDRSQLECLGCGGRAFAFTTRSMLEEGDLRLSEAGVTPGRVIHAHTGEKTIAVVPQTIAS